MSIISIYPNSDGFGFALMDGAKVPLEVKSVHIRNRSNQKALKKVSYLLEYYRPEVIILEDYMDTVKSKSKRIVNLIKQIDKLSKNKGLKVKYYSRKQIRDVFQSFKAKTKYEIAKCLSQWYPELKAKMPVVKKCWESQDFRTSAFDALSLAICFYYLN